MLVRNEEMKPNIIIVCIDVGREVGTSVDNFRMRSFSMETWDDGAQLVRDIMELDVTKDTVRKVAHWFAKNTSQLEGDEFRIAARIQEKNIIREVKIDFGRSTSLEGCIRKTIEGIISAWEAGPQPEPPEVDTWPFA